MGSNLWNEEDCIPLSEVNNLRSSFRAALNISASFEDYVKIDDETPSDEDILQNVIEGHGAPKIGKQHFKIVCKQIFDVNY